MTKQELEIKICEAIKERSRFNGENIELELDLRDNYGIDSIILVEMLIEMEEQFGVAFDSEMLSYDNFSTARAISEYIDSKLNSN